DLSESLRLDPTDAAAYDNRGMAYDGKGDYDRAIVDLGEAIRRAGSYSTAYSNRGKVYEKKGELEKALAEYNLAVKLNPHKQEAIEGAKRVQQALAPVGLSFPSYNIDAQCQLVASWTPSLQSSFDSCRARERNAADAVRVQWPAMASSLREYCEKVATVGGGRSYSALKVCVDLHRAK